MKEVVIIVGINLAILLAYSVVFYFESTSYHSGGFGYAVMMMLAVGAHSLSCLIIAIVLLLMKRKKSSNGFAIACLAVALIGFSFCLGGGKLADKSYVPQWEQEENMGLDSL